MMKSTIAIVAGAMLFLSVVPVSSQTFPAVPFRNSRQIADGNIAVQSSISFSLPIDNPGNYQQQQADAMASFYKMAAGNCALLVGSIAETCEITGLNSNTDIGSDGRGQRLTVRGQISMSVKLKSPTTEAK